MENQKCNFKPFNINFFWGVVCLWAGVLFIWLGRYPNQLSALIFDRWKMILPFVSVMILAFGFCKKFQWRVLKRSLIVVCVLFSILVLNFSVWMPIFVQNNTDVTLRAVMTDLSSNRIRTVSILPDRKKMVELLEAEGNTFGDTQWHLLIYDKTGVIYFQQVIAGSEIERGYTIHINGMNP